MKVTLSSDDVRALQATNEVFLSPLAYPSVDDWQEAVMTSLVKVFRADAAGFVLTMPQTNARWSLNGLDQSFTKEYADYYQYIDPTIRNPIYSSKLPGITSTTELTGGNPQSYRDTEVYDAFYGRYRIEDCLLVTHQPQVDPFIRGLRSDESLFSLGPNAVAVYRSRYGTEHFGALGLQLMRLIQPAIRAGIEMVQTAESFRSFLLESVDLLSEGVWVCSGDGDLLHQNQSMTRLLAADPDRGRLENALRDTVRTLILLSRTPRNKRDDLPLPIRLPEVRTRVASYAIRGSLITSTGFATAPGLLVFVERRSRELPSSDEVRSRFDLTRREAEIALLLAQRKRNEEIAEFLYISPHTARRHTEHVLLKLGVHTRTDVEHVLRQP